jgi:hypothetical protein
MYNFYLIAYKPEISEPIFEKLELKEDDAKIAGYDNFAEYCHTILNQVVEECENGGARYIILNQEEYMKLIIRMGQKMS